MPIIKNMLWSSLAIEISQEKTLMLEPRQAVSISDQELQSEECQKRLREESIIILPEGTR